jgi:flavin reductase (DIM6/NTAB) family NADH-FMN oxidoreductase RutF
MSELVEMNWSMALELGSPYPYTLAVTLDKNDIPNVIGISWWSVVSWSPQMVSISVGKPRYSHKCLEHCEEFVLCFPSEEQAEGAWLCGTISGRDVDNKFIEAGFKEKKAKVVKPPIIEDSTVAFECKVVNKVETGDHTLFIGEVVAVWGNTDKSSHLYTIHYRKLLSLDQKGKYRFLEQER